MIKTMNEKGYTMLELIVVICILGVIGAMSVISYGPTQTESYNLAALNDVKNVLTACQTCCFKGCSQCVMTTDIKDNEKAVMCESCPNVADETIKYVLSSPDIFMTLNDSPLICSNNEFVGAFHDKGNKTYCLYESTGDMDIYNEKNTAKCGAPPPPVP